MLVEAMSEPDRASRPADVTATTSVEPPQAAPPAARVEVARAGANVPDQYREPPVVARLVVEVRSDGSRTIARGAMEDAGTGMKAAIEATGNSPLELALELAKSIATAPWFGKQFARGAIRALLGKL
jgi:hypothetical protein